MHLPNKSLENIVEKGETACNEQFPIFKRCFLPVCRILCPFPQVQNSRLQTLSVRKSLKFVVWERVKKPFAKPNSSVGIIVDLRTGGCWFDPQLGQYSFQGLMIVIVTGFIPLSQLSHVGKQLVAWKEYCAEYWSKELQESMDSCTVCRDITEILLKMALNTIQSINH